MPNNLYSRNLDSLTGAVYFVVGRGTEGGSASYQLSVAGVSRSEWGQLRAVAQNSGYSLGAIQVDLGQRGTWPLGATEGRSLREGEMTYVGAAIAESSSYAGRRGLPYTSDHNQLSTDLLTHGNGQRGRTSITFIDTDTRDSINAWAGSPEGQQWIHRNIDYAQVRNATQTAVDLLDKHPHNISDDQKFEAVCVLAKTANQFPGFLDDYERVLRDGGNYDDIVRKAKELHARNNVYAGNKARLIAEDYISNYKDPVKQAAMDSAHAKVGNPNFNPSSETGDLDIQMALSAIGQRSHVDPTVWRLQENLNELGIPDAKGRRLDLNGTFDKSTQQAVATFQRQLGMPEKSPVTADTLKAAAFYAGAPEILRKPLQPASPSELPEAFREPAEQLAPPGAPPHYRNDWLPRDAEGRPNFLHSRAAPEQSAAPEVNPVQAQLKQLQREMEALRQQRQPEAAHRPELEPGLPAAPSMPDYVAVPSEPRTVANLQSDLIQLGYHRRVSQPLQVSGTYDDATRQAVTAFQAQHEVPISGMADQATQRALQQALLAQSLHRQVADPREESRQAEQDFAARDDGRNQAELLPFSHPQHPQHALYADVHQRFQAKGHDLSEEQLSVMTGQMHRDGYKPGWQGDVAVFGGQAMVGALSLGFREMDLKLDAPVPSVQETMTTFQADQQRLAQLNQQQTQTHGRGLS